MAFERHRLDASTKRATALSFLNTVKVLLAVVELIGDVGVFDKVIDTFPVKEEYREIAKCAVPLIAGEVAPSVIAGTGREGWASRMYGYVKPRVVRAMKAVAQCQEITDRIPRAVKWKDLEASIRKKLVKVLAGPAGWALIALEASNEALPKFLSYGLSAAGSVEYQLAWTERLAPTAFDCEATLVGVSREGLPMVEHRHDPRCHPLENLRTTDIEQDAVTIEWDPVLGAASYEVTITSASGDPVTRTVQDPIAVVTPVVIGETYKFAVVAVGAEGETGEAGFLSYIHSPLQPPRALRVTHKTGTEITLEWDPVLGAASYEVTITSASGDPVTRTVRAPIAVVTPVVIGETYNFAVVAVSDAGEAGHVAELGYIHTLVPAPRALRVTHTTAASIQLEWDAQGSEGGYGYRVEVIDGYGAGHTVGYIKVDALMYTAEGLEQGIEYCFLVTPVNDHNDVAENRGQSMRSDKRS